jgi:hypothetical protein
MIDSHSFPNQPLPCDDSQATDRPVICLGTDALHTPGLYSANTSDAVYRVLDIQTDDIRKLVVSTAEAAMAKKWLTFKRGDLTRDATYRQQADNHQGEAAIDNLIELGWIVDITPATVPGKRGRRSDGAFSVNPSMPHT